MENKNSKFKVSRILRAIAAIQLGICSLGFFVILLVGLFTGFRSGAGESIQYEFVAKIIDLFIVGLISYYLYSILNHSIKHHPFDQVIFDDLKNLGIILIVYAVIYWFVFNTFQIFFATINKDILQEITDEVFIKPQGALLLALTIFSILEIIKIGINLKQENELTV